MSVVPQGRAIQAMYRDYRQGNLVVNRKYQRKLVWALEEKQSLIDSILRGYPLPLILLAERTGTSAGQYEIIDGMQRLNAIFTFIENRYSVKNSYFDLSQYATARQFASDGAFRPAADGSPLLSPRECALILDYQLALSVFPPSNDAEVTDVFGRINSGGRLLSAQEQRQAGETSQFSTLVRKVAAELRGDVSQDIVDLSRMPEISIDSDRQSQGYGVRAEDTLWCHQGVLSIKQLKESEDEQLIADTAISIVDGVPLAVSKEALDPMYDSSSQAGAALERKTVAYGVDRLAKEIKYTFSVLKQTIESVSTTTNFLRTTVRPGGGGQYPIKAPFYAIFMAFFDLIVTQQRSPVSANHILTALKGLANRLKTSTHYETTENRQHNINLTKGLIQDHFAARVPPVFGHGESLVLDLENAVRRSKIESSRYEFKQGLLRLDNQRTPDPHMLQSLAETVCGIANVGPDAQGNLFIGIADKKADADRISQLDGVSPYVLSDHFVVGIEREATLQNITLDNYVQRVVAFFQSSSISEPLRTQLLSGFDCVAIHGFTILRISIPPQKALSFVGDRAFARHGSSTVEISGQQILAASRLFPSL